MTLDPKIATALAAAHDQRTKAGTALTSAQLDSYYRVFRDHFGPGVLSSLDGEELLERMHGRGNRESLMYWLEFKGDDEFPTAKFGSIAGGSALKFGIYRRKETGSWMTGSAANQRELTMAEALDLVRRQRDQLIEGTRTIEPAVSGKRWADIDYAGLDRALHQVAADVCDTAWGHKYFSLLFPDAIDNYHSPTYQSFHLIKALERPPEGGRYVAAARFVEIAEVVGLRLGQLTAAMNERNGAPHRYWRVGTMLEHPRDRWKLMRDGACVAIGWDALGDLSAIAQTREGKERLQALMHQHYPYPDSPQSEGRATSQVFRFVANIAEGDLVVAADGRRVLGIGRVVGEYQYTPASDFPHRRPVEWLSLEEWELPTSEGLRTTVVELSAVENLIAVEKKILDPQRPAVSSGGGSRPMLERLGGIPGRIQTVLERKSQVILYGPPGTGKTHWAEIAARELAARGWYAKEFEALSDQERVQITGPATDRPAAVQICTFHPAFGYEDFIEGFRPEKSEDQLVFVRRDGLLKQMASWARDYPDKPFYLIIDEVNRGDVPRIFGELLTILEKSKRGKVVRLSLSGEPFSVPPNLHLIGTMNTADRSIALLDTALRRRFGFIEMMPDSSVLGNAVVEGIPLGAWLDALNSRLREHIGRDARNLQIGHSYFMHGDAPITDPARFIHAIQDEIVPLLEEYCYEDYDTLERLLGADLVDRDRQMIRSELFRASRKNDLIQALLQPCPEIVASQRAVDTEAEVDLPEDEPEDAERDE